MNIVLALVFAAIFFYVLYGVIRAATRDGILAARQHLAADVAEDDQKVRRDESPS
jgi:hypothetical protein